MRKTLSIGSFFTAFSMLLAGCPVWGPDTGVPVLDAGRDAITPTDRGTPDTGPTTCQTNIDCSALEYCDPTLRVCTPTNGCGTGASCDNGFYCDNRGACVPGCSATADCTRTSANLVCDTTGHVCVPGGTCSTNVDCTGGQVCVGGSCRAPSDVCQFNYQCRAGQACVNGRCLADCTAQGAMCPAGQTCSGGFCQTLPTTGSACGAGCPAGQICVASTCQSACTADLDCGTGQFCDHGACKVDDRRPPPFCTPPSTGCASGSVCVDGVCRISCPTGTADECLRRDVNFNQCDTTKICRYSNEIMPQCQRNTDCSSGRICVNALCVNPI